MLSTTAARNDYVGNGSTTVFAYSFKIFAASDLKVIRTVTATGVETVLTITTDYSVSGVGLDAGGNVTMVTAPTSAQTLSIIRNRPLTQTTDFINQSTFFPKNHETSADHQTMLSQRLNDLSTRSLRLPDSDPGTGVVLTVPIAALRASKFLAFDGTGNAIAVTGSPSLSTALEGATATTSVLTVRVTGDAQSRMVLFANGAHRWGSGAVAPLITLLYAESTNSSTINPTLVQGYNASGLLSNADNRINTAEPGLTVELEGDFNTGTAHQMEWNLNYRNTGSIYRRGCIYIVDRSTHVQSWQFRCSGGLTVTNDDATTTRFGIDSNANIGVNTFGSLTARLTVKDTAAVQLKLVGNAGDTAYAELQVSSTGVLSISPTSTAKITSGFRIDGGTLPSTGEGIVVAYNPAANVGGVASFDADASLHRELQLDGNPLTLNPNVAAPVIFDNTAPVQYQGNSPATITADQNDYAIGNGVFFRLASDAARNITGIAGGTDGRVLTIANVGSNNIVLQNQNAGSAAGNRIITGTGADATLAADDTALLVYDNTTTRWRIINVH